MRDMAVGPGSMLPSGRTRGIVQALLGKDHVGCLSMLPCTGSMLGGGNFGQRAPQMHRRSVAARFGLPRDGAIESPIHLERCSAISVAFELPPIALWQAMAGQAQYLPGRDIEKNSA